MEKFTLKQVDGMAHISSEQESRINEQEKIVTALASKFDNFRKVVNDIDEKVGSFSNGIVRLNEK